MSERLPTGSEEDGCFEPVIGLEVHVQLNTNTKIFCGCSTGYAYQPPNTFVCPVCLGLPGVLPVLNSAVLEKAVRTILAVGGEVSAFSKFDRKNYFYPDLSKAYQISQYDKPIGRGGGIDLVLDGVEKHIRINRIHMEEDAGKLTHDTRGDSSCVDYNRAGVPLLEIVSEPDIRSSAEAKEYLIKLKAILEYIEVSTCNMEEGTLRCDANVSIRPRGREAFGTRAEIKNLNSFKWVARALDHEIERQIKLVQKGGEVVQETRLWDENKGVTRAMRSKEEAHDYRYFPDPDLPPIRFPVALIETSRRSLPELPDARRRRFVECYGLPAYDAGVLTSSRELAEYFEAAVAEQSSAKTISNWIMTELLGRMNESGETLATQRVPPANLGSLVALIESGVISGKMAKDVFNEMFEKGLQAKDIVKARGLEQISDDSFIESVVDRILEAYPNVVSEVKSGKTQAKGFLVGQIMKETKGKANPNIVNQILQTKLGV